MRPTIDLTDVARVSSLEMTKPMSHMIEAGRGLVLINGAGNDELRQMDQAVWDQLAADPAQRIATLLRFRALIQVFRALRLKTLLLQKGFPIIAPALHVAASMRLNAERGFNPLKFERALRETMAAAEAHRAAAPRSPEPPLQAAA